jgi:hypothetical protein
MNSLDSLEFIDIDAERFWLPCAIENKKSIT